MISVFGNPEVLTVYNTQPVYPVGVLSRRFSYPDLDQLGAAIRNLSRACWAVNATQLAMELDSPIVANIIMLGALTACGAIPVTMDEVKVEMGNTFPASKMGLNLRALDSGYHAIR